MPEPLSLNGQTAMIGIGEYRVGSFPMMTIGLGSCIGLVIYDGGMKKGAMVHIMLPESTGRTDRPGKYADTAIPLIVNELLGAGCRKKNLAAKMAGGSCMFEYFGANLNIGERNIQKVREVLAANQIKLEAEDVGGKFGRSVTFFPESGGRLSIRRADGTTKDL
ncbi:MAG TPA: chemotaxis protein CheD [Methanoregula sp.]|nr:chemotaxis protein CheD [Methanoregula sp.]